ncbi:GGDEF domain-containing protein [Marinobacter sp. SS21]|uniref:GGDEF domain-containing protein n=1 Tax=Marinobacter sp. SS21 TaxID=2979460 RepID=UPI00232C9412|nr:GGDEF domain-containing protein [Marinobacter sp. SS21]MDC0663584.1 GGDEF domain-containing protein [Marinobacter sp. SS21]
MNTVFSILENRNPGMIWKLALSIMVLIVFFQIMLGRNFDMAPIYIFPIVLSCWYGTKKSGVALSILSVLVIVVLELYVSGLSVFSFAILAHGAPYLIAYPLFAMLLVNFRNVHQFEALAADTDSLTGVHSSRSFYSELANELIRAKRYSHEFSLAYIDVDNFKNVNDSFGHAVGDQLLREVAKCLVSSLRSTDIVARLGGDEYACLLPETEQHAAKAAFSKAIKCLDNKMKMHGWLVSFSVGVATFENFPEEIDEVMDFADQLMYSVKNENKNNISYEVYTSKL